MVQDKLYPFETGSLTADTWTKITKTIPGNSNLQLLILIMVRDSQLSDCTMYWGTDYTDSGVSLNAVGCLRIWNKSHAR